MLEAVVSSYPAVTASGTLHCRRMLTCEPRHPFSFRQVEGSLGRALANGCMPDKLEDILVVRVPRGSDRYRQRSRGATGNSRRKFVDHHCVYHTLFQTHEVLYETYVTLFFGARLYFGLNAMFSAFSQPRWAIFRSTEPPQRTQLCPGTSRSTAHTHVPHTGAPSKA